MKNYTCKIKLSKYLDARIIELDNDETGKKERGIFIPIDINELFVTKDNQVISKTLVYRRYYTGDGNSHHIKPLFSKTHRDYIESLGFSSPFLATMRPTNMLDKFQSTSKKQSTIKKIDYQEEDL